MVNELRSSYQLLDGGFGIMAPEVAVLYGADIRNSQNAI
jgi:hypothetical protein